MRGIEMLQQPEQLEAGQTALTTAKDRGVRVLRLLVLLAMGTMLAACDRCGDFWPRSQSQIGACHSDPPRQQ
jgi:hypothetical protein